MTARDDHKPSPAAEPTAAESARSPVGATDHATRTRRVARASRLLGVLPYVLLVALATWTASRLLVPALLIYGAVYAVYEHVHADSHWRHPAGWILGTGLLMPAAFVVGYGTAWPALLAALPAAVLWAADRRSSGRLGRWWAPQPAFGTLAYLMAVFGLMYLFSQPLMPRPTDDVLIDLYAAPAAVELDQDGMEQAVALVDHALRTYRQPAKDGGAMPAPSLQVPATRLPTVLRQVDHGGAHVTLWLGREPPLRGHAADGALYADLMRATRRALETSKQGRRWSAAAARVRIQIDIAGEPVEVRLRPLHMALLATISTQTPVAAEHLRGLGLLGQLPYQIEPGVDGLLLRGHDAEATMLPADPVLFGWLTPRVEGRQAKVQRLVAQLSEQAGGPKDRWRAPGVTLYKFRSTSFGRPTPELGGEVVRLFRGNVLREGVDSDAIVNGIAEAGRWLTRVVRPDGSFEYEYLPNADKNTPDYNAVRHAGCVYGLYHLYRLALQEDALRPDANRMLESAIRAERWLHQRLRPPPDAAEGEVLVALVEGKGVAESGSAALSLLGLLERPPAELVSHPVLREELANGHQPALLQGLGAFLLATVDPDGRVFRNYAEARQSERVAEEPLYFPGEVMLALARLYRADGEPRWLEGAERIARARMERFDGGRNPDHWDMQALWELYDLTGKEAYARAGLAMGQHYAAELYPPNWAPFADYVGSYRRNHDVPRTTRAASRCEALGGIVQIAWRTGADATVYEDALVGAAEHLLEHIWRPENSYYLPNRGRARGAVRMGLVDNHCRIDNNQHAIVGLHRALGVARRREGVATAAEPELPSPPSDDEAQACRQRFER